MYSCGSKLLKLIFPTARHNQSSITLAKRPTHSHFGHISYTSRGSNDGINPCRLRTYPWKISSHTPLQHASWHSNYLSWNAVRHRRDIIPGTLLGIRQWRKYRYFLQDHQPVFMTGCQMYEFAKGKFLLFNCQENWFKLVLSCFL